MVSPLFMGGGSTFKSLEDRCESCQQTRAFTRYLTRGPKYNWIKWASSVGWLHALLETGWEARSPREPGVESLFLHIQKSQLRGLEQLVQMSPRRRPPGKTQDTQRRLLPGVTSESPRRTGGSGWTEGSPQKSGDLCIDCYLHDPVLDEWKKMDGSEKTSKGKTGKYKIKWGKKVLSQPPILFFIIETREACNLNHNYTWTMTDKIFF